MIGLEVHAQLATRSKLFSSAPNAFGGEPNTQTNEVDLGLPGVLPVLNEGAVELAVRAALALGCQIQPVSVFARKHYFYPDLPKGYQISQYEEPFALGGGVPIWVQGAELRVPLERVHMEEDAAKSTHEGQGADGAESRVNLNRAGTPLIEIVSKPAIRAPAEAALYFRSLRSILRAVGASHADMEKGQLRCDANVSVRRGTETQLGTKVEVKNLNSFRFVERALAYEIERQVDALSEGGTISQETRLWDDAAGRTRVMRSKEYADDYRYFPDPDLIALKLEPTRVEGIRAKLPELPHQKRRRFVAELGLSEDQASTLSEDPELAALFEGTLALHPHAERVAHWIQRDVLALAGGDGPAELKLAPQILADLLDRVAAGSLTAASGRQVLAEVVKSGADVAETVAALGLEAIAEGPELESIVREVLASNPENVAKYRGGEEKVFHFFVGQVMRRTRGRAAPDAVRRLLERWLRA
ncbi:MAG: Asp-tRNA(Asn)/Glu-tRNA(Gln) amidotransferase subunit GatB [Myxococcota bacterium]